MSAKNHVRFGLLCLASAALAGCANHTYGVSVTPSAGVLPASQYLTSQGFTSSGFQRGDVLSMQRRHGDSLDHVRIFRGGPSPGLPAWSSSGSGYAGGSGAAIPISAASSSGGMYSPGSPGGSSGKLTIEIATYRIDRDGKRHQIEPHSALFDQADSVITLMTRIPSSQRH